MEKYRKNVKAMLDGGVTLGVLRKGGYLRVYPPRRGPPTGGEDFFYFLVFIFV